MIMSRFFPSSYSIDIDIQGTDILVKNEDSINNASNCFPYKINIQYFEYDSRYHKASFVYTVDKVDNKTVLAEMISESGYYNQDLHDITERLLEDMKNLDKTEESVET